jgi:hypothetical protein
MAHKKSANHHESRKQLDNMSTNSNKEFQRQAAADQGDDCVAYASKEEFNEVIKPATTGEKP